MSETDFADRYAEEGIAPKSELIEGRKQAADRLAGAITKEQIFGLVSLYFGMTPPDMAWFRDEFRKEDPAFSLVHNERECVILAALILAKKLAAKDGRTILSIVTGWMQGQRTPLHAGWLLDEARSVLRTHAAQVRRHSDIPTEIKAATNAKFGEELNAVAANDFNALLQALLKVRAESQAATNALATQMATAIAALTSNLKFQREESQILWWLFAAHSRSLNKPFSAMRTAQAAIVAGIELGELSIASVLGPVAAPAVLERVLDVAKRDKHTPAPSIMAAINNIGAADLVTLRIPAVSHPVVFPMMTALGKAKEVGIGSWGAAFQNSTAIDPDVRLAPAELALQTYHEHLLGQL